MSQALPFPEQMDNMQCRVCNNPNLVFVKFLHGEYHHRDVPLYKCRACSSYFSQPERFETQAEFGDVFSLQWDLSIADSNRKKRKRSSPR